MNSDNDIKFTNKYRCVKCGAPNQIIRTQECNEGVIEECETHCTSCKHVDYWAHGAFESVA